MRAALRGLLALGGLVTVVSCGGDPVAPPEDAGPPPTLDAGSDAGSPTDSDAGAVDASAPPGPRPTVAIVGGGIAGLAAARELADDDVDVVILEREDRVGGRMRSITDPAWPDGTSDVGAQFFTPTYGTLLAIAEEVGFTSRFVPQSPLTATVRDGFPIVTDARDPNTLWSRGLISTTSAFRVATSYDALVPRLRPLPLHEMGAWRGEDGASTHDWMRSDDGYGEEAARYVAEPALESLFFYEPRETSQTIFFWMASNLDRGGSFQTLVGSTGELAVALGDALVARGVTVRTGAEVTRVEPDGEGAAVTLADGEVVRADVAIVTTPAPVSAALVADPTPAQRAIVEQEYVETIVVNLFASRRYESLHALGDVGGLVIPAVERDGGPIVSLSIESGKRRGPLASGEELYGVHVSHAAAQAMAGSTDEAITAAVVDHLDAVLPGVRDDVVSAVVHRWTYAIPASPVGRPAALDALWDEQEGAPGPVLLAGDQTAFATMEASARSGVRAAELARARLER